MDIIDRINQELQKAGIAGSEMCRELGFSSGVYSQWNTKKTKPSSKTLKRVAEYLNVSVDCLLGLEVEQKEKPDLNTEDGLREWFKDYVADLTREELQQVSAYIQGMLDARRD